MNRQLLTVIDPQNDFTHRKGNYAQRHPIVQISDTKQRINKLLSLWPKSGIVVVYSNYEAGQFDKDLAIGIPDTFGHKLDTDFDFDSKLTYISKSQHSAFSSENFKNHLKTFNPETLVLCGFLAEYCVNQTAVDAIANDFKVSLIEDCIGTGDDVQERKLKMILSLKEKGAEIITSDKITHSKNFGDKIPY